MKIASKASRRNSRSTWVLIAVVVVIVLLSTAYFVRNRTTPWNMMSAAIAYATTSSEPFPDIDTSQLSSVRQQMIALAEQEYEAQPVATKYSQGVREAWCADFLSWIMNEVDRPFVNPHSNSWRIPGVYTLKDYYVSTNSFRSVESGYKPVPGDTAIYYDSPIFGTHVHMVLDNTDDVLTTVGGNESGKIRVYKNTDKNYVGLIGYGVAP